MLQVELPHVNVLSKLDLIEKYDKLQFNLDFYTDVLDLNYLTDYISDDRYVCMYACMYVYMFMYINDNSLVYS